ncbi:dethiobiotin synthase [Candidatus Thioglobus sp.]|nr:dethiobiotin synthase [Candidatus Thioglobus sp.]
MNGVFITGSNTEVGKTTVSVEIIKYLRKKRKIIVRKPVETDCDVADGIYVPKDATKLNEACSSGESLSLVCPFRYQLEASPEEASNHEGKSLELNDLVKACKSGGDKKFVFVEGAGGFYSPIANNSLNSDLAAELGMPIIIVVKDELGAIGQALLTINAAKSQKLKIACVVLNEMSTNYLSNAEALRSYTETPIVEYSNNRVEAFCLEIDGLI